MKTQLEQRLQQLKTECASGQQRIAELEEKQRNLRNTLLRICGAIQQRAYNGGAIVVWQEAPESRHVPTLPPRSATAGRSVPVGTLLKAISPGG